MFRLARVVSVATSRRDEAAHARRHQPAAHGGGQDGGAGGVDGGGTSTPRLRARGGTFGSLAVPGGGAGDAESTGGNSRGVSHQPSRARGESSSDSDGDANARHGRGTAGLDNDTVVTASSRGGGSVVEYSGRRRMGGASVGRSTVRSSRSRPGVGRVEFRTGVRVACAAFGEDSESKRCLTALFCSSGVLVLRCGTPDDVPSVRYLPWFADRSRRIVSMAFSPCTKILAATTLDGGLFLIPALAMVVRPATQLFQHPRNAPSGIVSILAFSSAYEKVRMPRCSAV